MFASIAILSLLSSAGCVRTRFYFPFHLSLHWRDCSQRCRMRMRESFFLLPFFCVQHSHFRFSSLGRVQFVLFWRIKSSRDSTDPKFEIPPIPKNVVRVKLNWSGLKKYSFDQTAFLKSIFPCAALSAAAAAVHLRFGVSAVHLLPSKRGRRRLESFSPLPLPLSTTGG